jgi:pimeloyl-ACP methyl ester carboxylesterase
MSLDEIYITRWGSGPPVVMVHGSAQGGPAGGAEQFGAQRPLVDHGWELVLPDRPGHGRSPSRGPEDLELDEAPIFSVVPNDLDAQATEAQLAAASAHEDPLAAIIAFSQAAGIPRDLLPAPSMEQLALMGAGLQQMRPPATWDASTAIDTIAAVGIPALVVTGGWNPGFEAVADEVAQRLQARRVVINAGHHFPHLASSSETDSPGGEFNSAVETFLRST